MLTRFNRWIHARADVLLLVIRLWTGLVMAFGHGLGKISDLSGFSAKVGSMGFPLPGVLGPAAAISEFVGGICLALGLLTRPFATLITITMVNAAFVVHAADPFGKKEFALAYAALGLVFLAVGPGRFSLDRVLGLEKAS